MNLHTNILILGTKMAKRVLYRTKEQAYAAAKKSGEPFYTSTCDCGYIQEIADAELASGVISGKTGCFKGPNGLIFAWWEK